MTNLKQLIERRRMELETLTGDEYQTDYYPVSVDWLTKVITEAYHQGVRDMLAGVPEEITKEHCPISKMQLETMGLDHTRGFVNGHNDCRQTILEHGEELLGAAIITNQDKT
jgi:hypothetical protein